MANKIKDLEYPLNLIYAVFEDGAEEIIEKIDTISDFNASVEYILYTLSDREREILKHRFIDLMPLEKVGHIFGVTRDRIRQIEARALRKLRQPSRIKYLRFGISGVIENIRTDYYNKFSELEGKLIELCKLNEKAADEIIHDTELKKKYGPIKIEDMDLSVRSYNCLKRARIDNIKQLASLSYEELIHIRNLGIHSVNEIIEKLKDYGYDTQRLEEEKNNG